MEHSNARFIVSIKFYLVEIGKGGNRNVFAFIAQERTDKISRYQFSIFCRMFTFKCFYS